MLLQDISGLTLIDGNTMPYPGHHKKVEIGGWVSKAFALYMCSFSQVMHMPPTILTATVPYGMLQALHHA